MQVVRALTASNGQSPFTTIGVMPSRLQNVTGKEHHFTGFNEVVVTLYNL
jgi:hypothetical protein